MTQLPKKIAGRLLGSFDRGLTRNMPCPTLKPGEEVVPHPDADAIRRMVDGK